MIQIPNYTVKKVIGRGGMALVYLAVQDMLSREVALKVLMPDMMKDENLRKSFLNEGKIVASLKHPNIVSIFDIGIVDDSIFYMAMEYICGGTLKERLLKEKISYNAAIKALEEISEGLSYAHEQGYIHRDVKPGNILFREDGSAVITDFGIAKLQDTSGDLTRLGLTVGTAQYMSPEQAKSSKIDSRSDIYSLGLVFFEMLTGEKAFKFDTNYQAIQQHSTAPPPKLPKEFAFLQKVINKVLAKKPKQRYQTTLEFVQAVKNSGNPSFTSSAVTKATIHADTTVIHTAQQPFITRLKRNLYLLLSVFAGLALVAVIIIGIVDYSNKTPSPNNPSEVINHIEKEAIPKPKVQVTSLEESTNKPSIKEKGGKTSECKGKVFINGIQIGKVNNARDENNTSCINTKEDKPKLTLNTKPKITSHVESGCDNLASLVEESLSRVSDSDLFGMSAHSASSGFLCAQRELNNQLEMYKTALQKGDYDTLEKYIYPPIKKGRTMQNLGEVLILPYLPSDKVSTHAQLIALPFKKYSKGIYVNVFSNILMTMDLAASPAELQQTIKDGLLREAQKSAMKILKKENSALNITFKKNTLEATFYKRSQIFAIYELNKGWSLTAYDRKMLNKIKGSLPKKIVKSLTESVFY